MATVDGYTKDHMDAIIAGLIVSAEVIGGRLIITRQDSGTFDAGSVIGPVGPTGPVGTLIETGDIVESARDTKTGFLICQGGSYLRADYPTLSAICLPKYGSVDGTHFNVPDYRNRSGIGAGGSLAATVGVVGGAATHALSVAELAAHGHGNTGAESAGHSHNLTTTTSTPSGIHWHQPILSTYQFVIGPLATSTQWLNEGALADHGTADVTFTPDTALTTTGDTPPHTHSINANTGGASAGHVHATANAGSGTAHNNMPPFIGANFFIKT